jgi:cytochrome c-type biogenesis protein CcmH/NrfG
LNLHQFRGAEQAFARAVALAPDNKMARAGLDKARQAQAPAAH